MDIHMEQRYGDGDHWSMTFISKGFEFTEADLKAVRFAIGPKKDHKQGPSWSRDDGLNRTNRITFSCTLGQRPGPTVRVYYALKQRYPSVRFTMYDMYLRQQLNKQNLDITKP